MLLNQQLHFQARHIAHLIIHRNCENLHMGVFVIVNGTIIKIN